METCGCMYEPILGPTGKLVGGNIVYCSMHRAAPDGYKVAVKLIESLKWWARRSKYATCPLCEGYRIGEANYEHGNLCPAYLAEKYLALVKG